MQKTRKIKVEQEERVSFTCDKCGKEMADDIFEAQEAICIDDIGGYGSVFGDGVRVELDLCQTCFKELLGQYCRLSETSF